MGDALAPAFWENLKEISDMFSNDTTNADGLQIRMIFKFMKSEYYEAVVKRALDSRDKVSEGYDKDRL